MVVDQWIIWEWIGYLRCHWTLAPSLSFVLRLRGCFNVFPRPPLPLLLLLLLLLLHLLLHPSDPLPPRLGGVLALGPQYTVITACG